MRVRHVGHQADAGRGKAGVFGSGTVDGTSELGRELAANRRYIDADLLENLAFHQAACPAAGIGIALFLAVPFVVLETGVRSGFALDAFEFGADTVAKGFEPATRLFGFLGPIGHERSLAIHRRLRQ